MGRPAAKILAALALVLLPLQLLAQVTADGPTTATVGERVTLDVGGLPVFDLTKPIGESLAWSDQMRFSISSPDDKARLDSTIGIDFLSKQWRLSVSFVPRSSGVYVVAIADPTILIQHRVTVGGEGPPPNPPIPVVVKSPRVIYLRETKDARPEDAALVIELRAAYPKMLILDKDQEPGKKHYDPSKPLPQLVVLDGDVVLYRDSSPGDAAKIAEVIGRYVK